MRLDPSVFRLESATLFSAFLMLYLFTGAAVTTLTSSVESPLDALFHTVTSLGFGGLTAQVSMT